VSYGIDNAQLLVWLDNSHVPEREHAGRLCRRHANALVVPRGWSVDDRRQPIPQLFRELERSLNPDGRGQVAPRKTQKKQRKSSSDVENATPTPMRDDPTLFETPASDELSEQEPPVTQVATTSHKTQMRLVQLHGRLRQRTPTSQTMKMRQ
jgi:hypothetical protein